MEMPARRSIVERMRGAALLDVATYEEVEHDETATGQAAVVVALAAVAGAIGGARSGSGGVIAGIVAAFAGWLIWAGVTWFVGTRLFKGTAHWGELLRTLGFAQTPGLLMALAFVPILGWFVRFVVFVWLLVTGVVAIRQALDIGTGQAVVTAIVAWLIVVVVMMVLGGMLGLAF
jgi:hypothetical protein